MSTPSVEGLLTVPYVTVPEFESAPTWIDNADLVPSGTGSQQGAELYNVLLRASGMADDYCGLRLGAHSVTENTRARMDACGNFKLHPSNVPVRSVTSVSYGSDIGNLASAPTPLSTWIEDDRGVVLGTRGSGANWGQFQFTAPSQAGLYFLTWSYVAGYAATALTSAVSQGAVSLPLADVTGIQPCDVLRIWDPGNEEAVSVASTWAPTTGPDVLPVSPLVNDHIIAAGVSGLPAEVKQAVIIYAVALLLRDVNNDPGDWPTGIAPVARQHKGASNGAVMMSEAERLLNPYRRIR